MHKIDELTIKTLRVLSVEQIAKASSVIPIALGLYYSCTIFTNIKS